MGTKYKGNKATARALDAFIKLNRAYNSVHSTVNRSIAEAGLTASQFGVLEALLHLGPSCQRDLAGKILKTGGNLTMVIDNLERDGLVQRLRSPEDRRYITVQLTAAGKKLIEDVFPRHAEEIRAAFATLSSPEQRQLGELCRKLGHAQRAEGATVVESIDSNRAAS